MSEKLKNLPRKVLVVEDDKTWQELIPEIFDEVDTLVVDSVEAAKEAFKKGDFTEIVTDGLEGRWVEIAKLAGDTPLKLLTGNPDHEDLANSMNVPYIYKPAFEFEDLTG